MVPPGEDTCGALRCVWWMCPGPHVTFAVDGMFLSGPGGRPHLVTACVCEFLYLWERSVAM